MVLIFFFANIQTMCNEQRWKLAVNVLLLIHLIHKPSNISGQWIANLASGVYEDSTVMASSSSKYNKKSGN